MVAGTVSTGKGGGMGATKYPNATSLVEVVKKMGCLRCLGKHEVCECMVPKTITCTYCSKPEHTEAACFSKICTELPKNHAALQVATKNVPALTAPTGQEMVVAGTGCTSAAKCPPPAPALPTVPNMSNLRLVDVTSMTEEQRNSLIGPVRFATPHPSSSGK